MSVAFYMDVHIKDAITEGLRLRGVDVLTAQEDGYRTRKDVVLLERAAELGRVIFSNDSDFLVEASYRMKHGIEFIGVVYAPQNTAVGICVHDLELIGKVNDMEDMANFITFIPI